MKAMILLAALAAPAATPIALPDYASADYSTDAAVQPTIPICLAALAEEIQGRDFAAPIARAIEGKSLAEARRVLEVCVTFRLGAVVMLTSINQARREAADQAQPVRQRRII